MKINLITELPFRCSKIGVGNTHLLLNSKKTKEIVFDLMQKKCFEPIDRPAYFNDGTIENDESYIYIGTEINNELSWEDKSIKVHPNKMQAAYVFS